MGSFIEDLFSFSNGLVSVGLFRLCRIVGSTSNVLLPLFSDPVRCGGVMGSE